MRWREHHEDGLQPSHKWYQSEFLLRAGNKEYQWRILFDQPQRKAPDYAENRNRLIIGKCIHIKSQVVTIPDGRSRYHFKQWVQNSQESQSWGVEGFEENDYTSGSPRLVPHNSNVTVHEVLVARISL